MEHTLGWYNAKWYQLGFNSERDYEEVNEGQLFFDFYNPMADKE